MCRYCSKSRKVRPNGRRIEFMQRKRNKKQIGKMKKHIILLSAAGLLFSSCGVYTKYKPATEVPTASTGKKRPLLRRAPTVLRWLPKTA